METVDWSTLPTLILEHVFTFLTPESRLAASSTCKQWRTALYRPMFWCNLTLDIVPSKVCSNIESKVNYINQHLVTLACNVHLSFDSHSPKCFKLVSSVVNRLVDNQLLKNINIKVTHCNLPENKMFENNSAKLYTYKWPLQNYLELGLLDVIQKGNIEGFSFGYIMFYYWYDLIHVLAKYSSHSLKRLELAGLGPSIFNKYVKKICFEPIFDDLSSLINLQKLSLDLNSNTRNLLPALCSMPQLEILVLHVHKNVDLEISDTIWADLKKSCPKLGLRLTIIDCHIVAKHLHTKLLRPSMPLTHLKVLFCNMVNVEVLRKLLDYRNTLQSLIWVDERFTNQISLGHWHREPSAGDHSNPLIILSWVCTKLAELVIFGYFIETIDVCGIARLRGTKLKRFELLEEDICFNESWSGNRVSMSFDDVTRDVSKWLRTNWRPLNKKNLYVSHPHYTLECISNDISHFRDV